MIAISASIFCACNSHNKIRKIYTKSEGIYEVGRCISDSIFNGVVNIYDTNNIHIGYSNYKFGLRNGLYVNLYPNGFVKDSLFFLNGLKNGEWYSFYISGVLREKENYYNNERLGEIVSYDSTGNIKSYGFLNFEGKFIYSLKYLGNDTLETAELPIYSTDTIQLNKDKKIHLFLYLIYPPAYKVRYEIADFFDNKITQNEKIISNKPFYEVNLDMPKQGHNWAVVVYIFNTSKGKDDVEINVIN